MVCSGPCSVTDVVDRDDHEPRLDSGALTMTGE